MNTKIKLAKVLLVDDNPVDLMIHERLVKRQKQDSQVFKAKSAEEGLEVLKNEAVDLILLDIKMPGMDGFDFLEALRKGDYKIGNYLIFMVSSSIDPKDIEQAEEDVLVAGFLEKPLNKEKLDRILG